MTILILSVGIFYKLTIIFKNDHLDLHFNFTVLNLF